MENSTIIEEILNNKNWNEYRKAYDSLSFDDKKFICNRLDPFFPNQICFNEKSLLKVFKSIMINDLIVAELGCHRGHLAKLILDIYPNIKKWYGYDINDSALKRSVVTDSRFIGYILEKDFFLADLEPFNMFVCTHTLEHFTFKEVTLCLEKVSDMAEIIIVEIPIKEDPRDWTGYRGTHVLEKGMKDIRNLFSSLGYGCFYTNKNVTAWSKNESHISSIV